MGRFMSPDWSADFDAIPYANLQNPQTLNLYGYTANNPLTNTDSDGHFTCTCPAQPDWAELQWEIENFFHNVPQATVFVLQNDAQRISNYFGKNKPVVPPVVTPAQTASPNPSPNNQNQNAKNKLSQKIQKQMAKRGWTEQSIDQTTSQPVHTSPSQNMATGNSATAYFNADGSYVVVDDVTNEVTQISDRTDPNWVPDTRIVDPYKP
jgi:hypothetical protein